MPWKQKTFRPKWIPKRDEKRPSSHARGYGSAAWQRTRLAVIARDGGICQLCGALVAGNDRDLHIDHIVPKGHGDPMLVERLENLRVVCRSCHSKRHREEG